MVIFGHGAFAFKDLNGDAVLVIDSSGKDLRFLGGDDGITGNQISHDSTGSLNTHGQRVDIQNNDLARVFFATQNAGLDGSTKSDSFIGIDASARLLSVEVFPDQLLDFGNASRSTNQDDFINVAFLHVSIFDDFLNWFHRRAEQVHVEFFELGARKSLGEVIALEETFNFNSDLIGW